MKRNTITTVTCIALIPALLAAAAFVWTGKTNEGYEVYKTAVIKTIETGNFSGDAVITVSDNDSKIVDGAVTFKTDWKNGRNSAFAILKANGKETTCQFYERDGKIIMGNSLTDAYQISYHGRNHPVYMEEYGEKGFRFIEGIMDFGLGNSRNRFALLKNTDGVRFISLELQGRRIPVKEAEDKNKRKNRRLGEFREYAVRLERETGIKLPDLKEDIRLERVGINSELDTDHTIKNQTVDIVVTGRDGRGETHRVEFNIAMHLYGFGVTVPDSIDLAGKRVTVD